VQAFTPSEVSGASGEDAGGGHSFETPRKNEDIMKGEVIIDEEPFGAKWSLAKAT